MLLLSPGVTAQDSGSPLRSTRRYVEKWLDGLPDFVCQQSTRQFFSNNRHTWVPDKSLDSELTVEQQREHYQLLTLNSSPIVGPLPVGVTVLGSQGEFLSAIKVLFAADSGAKFRTAGLTVKGGRRLRRLEFSVPSKYSQWYIGPEPSVTPEYSGTLWTDPEDGAIYRIEMEALRFPNKFPVKQATLRVDFSPAMIGEESFLLPNTAEIVLCASQVYCERRLITFSQYQRFSVRSRLLP